MNTNKVVFRITIYIFTFLNRSQISNKSDLLQAFCFNDGSEEGQQSWNLIVRGLELFFEMLHSVGRLVGSNTNDTRGVLEPFLPVVHLL